jgi:hypothetical protein
MDLARLNALPRPLEPCIFCGSVADAADRGVPDWALGHLDSPLRCVCEICRDGWMARLEQAAMPVLAPLLSDLPVTLTQDQAGTLTAWAVKIAMVLERLHGDPSSPFYTLDERSALKTEWAIPLWTGVWLSRYIGQESVCVGHPLESAGVARCTGYLTTLAYRHVALQVLSLRGGVGHDRPVILRARAGAWARSTLRIWPPRPHLQWPPPSSIVGENGLRTFAARWSVGQPPRYQRMPRMSLMRRAR